MTTASHPAALEVLHQSVGRTFALSHSEAARGRAKQKCWSTGAPCFLPLSICARLSTTGETFELLLTHWQADSIALGLARGVMAALTATGSGLSGAWCVDGALDHHT